MMPRVSLRTTRRQQKLSPNPVDDAAEEDETFAISSRPTRMTRSCVASPITPKPKPSPKTDALGKKSLDDSSGHDDLLSQRPTPSKLKALLPDYFGSQADGTCDVLWDCSSPNAVRHIRRRKKNESNVKEFVKHFKGPESSKLKPVTPPSLNILKSSLRRQQQMKNSDGDQNIFKRIKRSSRRRRVNNDHQQQELTEILCAVGLHSESSAEELRRKSEKIGAVLRHSSSPIFAVSAGTKDDSNVHDDVKDEEANSGEGLDSMWDDDDLFKDNSFIIQATQHPEMFGDSVCTSSPMLPKAQPEYPRRVSQSQQSLSQNNIHTLDLQTSGVIPPTLEPAGSKQCYVAGDGTGSKLADPVPVSQDDQLNSLQINDLPVNKNVVESPRSRFRLQRQTAYWPKRQLHCSNQARSGKLSLSNVSSADSSPISSQARTTAVHMVNSAARHSANSQKTHQQDSVPHQSLNTGGMIQSVTQQSISSKQRTQTAEALAHQTESCEKQLLSSESGSLVLSVMNPGSKVQSANTGVSILPQKGKQQSVNTKQNSDVVDLKKLLSTNTANTLLKTARNGGFTDSYSYTSSRTEKEPISTVSDNDTASRKSRLALSTKKRGKDMTKPTASSASAPFDDSLSEELLLQLTEQDEEFESQVIQEFPTQAPRKLDSKRSLVPTADVHVAGFDELDYELISSVCEYDSFAESPQKVIKENDPQSASVISSEKAPTEVGSSVSKPAPGNSKRKQPVLYDIAPHKPAKVSVGGSTRDGFKLTAEAEGIVTVRNAWASSSSKQSSGSGKSVIDIHPSSSRGRSWTTTVTTNMTKNSTTKPAGKKYNFRPLSDSHTGGIHQLQVAQSAKLPLPVTAKGRAPHVTDVSYADMSSQDTIEGNEDHLADDAFLESQIIALLDQVESQVSPQVTEPSAPKDSPLKCSQEEIEKKRQAAMERRLRSTCRLKGKPP